MAGMNWGHLSRQNGFYEYAVSPYQLKPFSGLFNPGAANFLRRTAGQLVFILPPALFFYQLAVWSDKEWEHSKRKAGQAEAAAAAH